MREDECPDAFWVFFGPVRLFAPRGIDIRLRIEKVAQGRKILQKAGRACAASFIALPLRERAARGRDSNPRCPFPPEADQPRAGECAAFVPPRGGQLDRANRWVAKRKGWDSNPRHPFECAAFRVRCLRPLSHPSASKPSGAGSPSHE